MPRELDDFDRTLAADDTLVPSSGFTARVMDAVEREADEPPPLAFPWRPFAIGAVACLVWAASAIALLTRIDGTSVRDVTAPFADAGTVSVELVVVVAATFIVLALQRRVVRR